jgi:hypothetical protein
VGVAGSAPGIMVYEGSSLTITGRTGTEFLNNFDIAKEFKDR